MLTHGEQSDHPAPKSFDAELGHALIGSREWEVVCPWTSQKFGGPEFPAGKRASTCWLTLCLFVIAGGGPLCRTRPRGRAEASPRRKRIYFAPAGSIFSRAGGRRGGIGRRARLKFWCPKGHVGSTPSVGTSLERRLTATHHARSSCRVFSLPRMRTELDQFGLHGDAGDPEPTGSFGLIAARRFSGAPEHFALGEFHDAGVNIRHLAALGAGVWVARTPSWQKRDPSFELDGVEPEADFLSPEDMWERQQPEGSPFARGRDDPRGSGWVDQSLATTPQAACRR
jgi:hypothetical protein